MSTSIFRFTTVFLELPWWLSCKDLPANEVGLILASGRSLRAGNGNPLQYPYLGNPTDREAWRATVYEVAIEFDMIE